GNLLVLLGLVAVVVVAVFLDRRRPRLTRERRVELAAAVAADDDPSFDPEAVRVGAGGMFMEVKDPQDPGGRTALAAPLTPGLFDEWCRQLNLLERTGRRRRAEVLKLRSVEYLGFVNRGREAEDRITVRIRAKMRDCFETRDGRPLKRDGSAYTTRE